MRWINRIGQLKLHYAGAKKVAGKQLLMVDVQSASGGNDFSIRLYFDAENFRHVKTVYHREVQIGTINVGRQNELANSQLDLVEEFSDYKEVDGMTFPYSYMVTFTSNTGTQVLTSSWSIQVGAYNLNRNLASDFYTFDVK